MHETCIATGVTGDGKLLSHRGIMYVWRGSLWLALHLSNRLWFHYKDTQESEISHGSGIPSYFSASPSCTESSYAETS